MRIRCISATVWCRCREATFVFNCLHLRFIVLCMSQCVTLCVTNMGQSHTFMVHIYIRVCAQLPLCGMWCVMCNEWWMCCVMSMCCSVCVCVAGWRYVMCVRRMCVTVFNGCTPLLSRFQCFNVFGETRSPISMFFNVYQCFQCFMGQTPFTLVPKN